METGQKSGAPALSSGIRKKIEKKRQREMRIVNEMIHLYCKKNHAEYDKQAGRLCPACQQLADYARQRSERCPFMESKTFCANCKIHCYGAKMRENIRKVMIFSGPRMLLYHPFLALWHVICSIKEKRKQKKREEFQ